MIMIVLIHYTVTMRFYDSFWEVLRHHFQAEKPKNITKCIFLPPALIVYMSLHIIISIKRKF